MRYFCYMIKPDIRNKDDIKKIVDTFYDKVRKNPTLGGIFNDVMHVNWETHLPKMYAFWSNILYGDRAYNGRPFPAHMDVNEKRPLIPADFNIWEELFMQTVDELYQGPVATEMKMRAKSIKEVWSYKIDYINKHTDDIK